MIGVGHPPRWDARCACCGSRSSGTGGPFHRRDHLRYYGIDFSNRLAQAGFHVETFRLTPELEVVFSLLPMEWLYVATRPA
jgi:hypothetical protein